MRFTTTRNALKPAVDWAWQAVEGRCYPISALPGVGLEVTGKDGEAQVRVVTANQDVTAQVRLGLAGSPAALGRAVVDGAQLTRILHHLPARGLLQVDADTEALWIRAGRGVHALRLLDAPRFPPFALSAASMRAEGAVAGVLLAEAVKQVAGSAATDEIPEALTAIQVGATRAGLSLIATDRYVLAVRELPWSWAGAPPKIALAPAALLARLVTGFRTEPAVRLYFHPEGVTLRTPARWLTLAHVPGDAPPGLQVVQQHLRRGGHATVVARQELAMACQQFQVYQPKRGQPRQVTPVELSLEPGQMRLRSWHEDVGRVQVVIKADYHGPPVAVHLTYRQLRHAIKTAGVSREALLEIEVASPEAPVWVRGQQPGGCALLIQPLLIR